MAKKNMTFSVSLSLLTKNFNKGIKAVQNSLRSLRAQFQTFVGGIGVGLGFQELIDNAKSLDKVQTTLRNVSGSYDKYGENMKFIQGLSKKYNQDLITLTGNYAKFYSAASYAGFALEEQQHIYESLTRASAYFNLTADETNGVMLAVQQMISKGRVSSEELRRQLGERLPGAMNLAAIAAGKAGLTLNGTTAELEEMIKGGKVLAKDLLPALANELDGLTQNFNVDTIQGATAKLKNSFTELVQKLKVGDIYKGFLNGVSSGLDYITKNLRDVAYAVSGVLGTLFLKGGMEKGVNGWNKFFKGLENKLSAAQAKVKVLQAETKEFAKENGFRIIQRGERVYATPRTENYDPEKLKESKKLSNQLNQQLREQNTIQEQLNNKFGTMSSKIWENVKAFGKMIGIQAAYYAIAAVLSTIVTKVIKWAAEQKRIRNLVKDTNDEFEKLSNKIGVDESDLTATRDRYLKKNADGSYVDNEKTRILLLARINKLLGLTGENELKISDSEEKINQAIEDRLALYKKEREYQAARQTLTDAENRKIELVNKKAAAQGNVNKYNELYTQESRSKNPNNDLLLYYGRQIRLYTKEIKTIDKELGQLNTVINNFSDKVAKLGLGAEERQSVLENTNPEPITDPDELKKLQEEYDKIQKEHNNKLRALNEQLADEVITKKDYDKALKDLYTSTLESIYSLDNVNENTDSFAKSILDRVKAFKANKEKEDKAEKALYEYYTKTLELANQLDDGLLTYEEYQDALVDLKEETLKNLSAMGELSDAAEELADTYRKQKADKVKREIGELEAPEMGEFETTLNYKKNNSEIYQENAEYIKDYAEQLDEYIDKLKEYQDDLSGADLEQLNDYITQLETNLETLTGKADSFAQAAKFAEVQEDVKNLKQELNEGIWDNITGIATAAERLTNSFKSLQETWDDPDASGWEKFITTFTTIISVIETIVSVVKTFNAAMKVAEALSLATAAAEGAQIPVKVQDAIATKAQAAAAKELAVARHLAASASVPYPANLAAIASTSAALAAAFAAIPKFAHGGYVKSNSLHGDRNLVRVNGNELILNTQQQGTLFRLLNGQGSPLNKANNVTFKIHGSDLVGTINNYTKKIGK